MRNSISKKKIITAFVILMAACSSAHSDYEEQAIAKGQADAKLVLDAKPGTLEQENAILHIRATEYQLRMAGDSIAAQTYINAAKQVLDSAKVFD